MKKIFLVLNFPGSFYKISNFVAGKTLFAFFLILLIQTFAYCADESLQKGFHPYISLEEEYNDNINLTSGNEKDDFITTIRPGLKYSNLDAMSGIDLDYNAGFVFYGKNDNLNYISHNAFLNAKYISKEHINLFLKNSFIRSEDPREREYYTSVEENKYVLSTTTQRDIYWRNVVSPTVEYQFGPQDRIGINYRNNIYRINSLTPDNSQEDYINPYLSWKLAQKNEIYLEYGYTIANFKRSSDFTGHRANTRYTNSFGPKLSAFGEYTYTTRDFDPPGIDYDIHDPSVGLTYAFSPTFNASAQVGYFFKRPETGSSIDGISYKANVTNRDIKTTYVLSLQGGYNEDYFTSENLGFSRYHRLTGSITHLLDIKTSIGLNGNIERATFNTDSRKEWIWGIGSTLSYRPLKWLSLSLDISHRSKDSNISINDYMENRAIFKITATY